MASEADLEQTEAGLVPTGSGWFVMNARDARWFDKPGQGHSLSFTGDDEYEGETFFPMLGMAIRVVNPGEPTGTYHWETEQEDFLVLSGQAPLIVEGQERVLDELEIHLVPVLLGQERRLFDHLDPEHIELERTRVLKGDGVTHMHYRVQR
ncbi:MAG: hypothetical protein WKF96_24795 [Solirubrobacteraceae bacterium]